MSAEGEVKVVITGEQTVTPAAEASTAAIKDLGVKTETGAAAAEGFNLKHREMREILHLIGREAGPEAAAAMSGLALAATGGIFAGVFAVEQLFDWLGQLQKEADAAAEKIRTRMMESVDAIILAKQVISDLDESNGKFWDKLATSSAEAGVKSDFDLLLQKIKDAATEAKALNGDLEKAGIISSEEKKKRDAATESATLQNEIDARATRANELQSSIDTLTAQLKNLQSRETNSDALKAQADLALAKKELDDAKDAIKNNKSFATTSPVFANSGYGPSIGILPNETPGNINAILTAMSQAITGAETQNKKVADHEQLLEQTIDRMTKEKDGLVTKNQSASSTQETNRRVNNLPGDLDALTRAESIADHGPQNQTEQQFIMRMASGASGRAMNLQQAEQYLQQLEKTPAALEAVLTRLAAYNASFQRQLDNFQQQLNLSGTKTFSGY